MIDSHDEDLHHQYYKTNGFKGMKEGKESFKKTKKNSFQDKTFKYL